MMWERWTERARHVVVIAQDEARRLKHDHLDTEHMLLGLLMEEEGLAARALASLNVREVPVRDAIVDLVGQGEEEQTGKLPFTKAAEKVCERALREALSLGHNYIGTEHVLLAVVRDTEGVAARILHDFDLDPGEIRREVIRILSGPGGEHTPSPPVVGVPVVVRFDDLTHLLDVASAGRSVESLDADELALLGRVKGAIEKARRRT